MPKKAIDAAPRRIVWKGRLFQEGGGSGSYYKDCQAGEIVREAKESISYGGK